MFTHRYFSFLISGSLAFGANLFVTYFLTEYFKLWYLYSVVAGTFLSWTAMFFLNSKYTFSDYKLEKLDIAYIKNIIIYIVLVPVSWGSVYLLTSIAGVHYLLSQIIVVGFMSIISFLLTSYYVFKIE